MEKEKTQKKFNLTPFIFGLVFLLVLTQLAISHSLATRGERLRQLEVKARELQRENSILAEEINQAGSLSRIAQEAERLGLVKAGQVFHLTSQVPVALGR